MARWKDDKNVDGLLFDYLHFYGSYDYIATSLAWYKYEVRVIRNDRNIFSYLDAQGFRKGDNQKLRVENSGAFIYHYGWVKPTARMMEKQRSFQKWWHDDKWMEKNVSSADEFDYGAAGLFSFPHQMPPNPPKQTAPITRMSAAGQRHACELNGRGVNWYAYGAKSGRMMGDSLMQLMRYCLMADNRLEQIRNVGDSHLPVERDICHLLHVRFLYKQESL